MKTKKQMMVIGFKRNALGYGLLHRAKPQALFNLAKDEITKYGDAEHGGDFIIFNDVKSFFGAMNKFSMVHPENMYYRRVMVSVPVKD